MAFRRRGGFKPKKVLSPPLVGKRDVLADRLADKALRDKEKGEKK